MQGSEWMTEDQEKVTTIYGWTSVGVLALVALGFLWGWYQSFRGLFRSTYEARKKCDAGKTKDSETNFSNIALIVVIAQWR
jgi:hypothetical protein